MRIALLEDDPDQAALIGHWLGQAGHRVVEFTDGAELLQANRQDSFDVYVLDWMLPGTKSGLDVLRALGRQSGARPPVLFVTAKDDERSIVAALDAGADDYLTKPLRKNETLARLNALGRRAGLLEEQIATLDLPPYRLDLEHNGITLHGEPVSLTRREYELARFLFLRRGQLVSRAHLLEAVWGIGTSGVYTRTVDTHISRIRKKLALNPENGWVLSSVYQNGYRLESVAGDTA